MQATKIYRFKPEAIDELLRQSKITLMILIVLLFFAILFVVARMGARRYDLATFAAFALMLGVAGWTVVQEVQRQRSAWQSFRLVLGPNFIRREQESFPATEIRREEVREIFEAARGGLTIVAGDAHRPLKIPAGVENYEELRAELQQWRPFESGTAERQHILNIVIAVVAALAFAAAHLGTRFVPDPVLLLALHIVALVGFLRTFAEMRRSYSLHSLVRWYAWVFFLLAAVEVLAIFNRLSLR